MPKLCGKRLTRKQFEKVVGNTSQVGGLRRVELQDGPARGLEVVELRTGAGLELSITTGRGLDILNASLGGMPLGWISPIGAVHPSYAQATGTEFLKTFPGGFLATCGLASIGAPCTDGEDELSIHGRYPTLPGSNVRLTQQWVGNAFEMCVEGEVREVELYGTNLVLRRKISATLGENRFVIEDEVQNAGPRRTPHQILYHFNLGYPLMDVGTETLVRSKRSVSKDAIECPVEPKAWHRFPGVGGGTQDEVFFHEPQADARGMARVSVVNRKANGAQGLAVALRFTKETLPWLVQWRNPCATEYVQGIEPSNGWVLGRDEDRKAGRLVFLRPGEVRRYRVECEALTGKKALSGLRA